MNNLLEVFMEGEREHGRKDEVVEQEEKKKEEKRENREDNKGRGKGK